jgi:hypothetical protein
MNSDRSSALRRWLLFVVLLVAYAYFLPRWADWNQNARLDMVLAVVDKGTWAIDDYHENTGDYATYHGHYYSDKAPGTSFLGIPIYWVFKILLGQPLSDKILSRVAANPALVATLNPTGTGLLTNKVYFFVALTFVTFFAIAVPSALLGVLVYDFLGSYVPFESTNGDSVGVCFRHASLRIRQSISQSSPECLLPICRFLHPAATCIHQAWAAIYAAP